MSHIVSVSIASSPNRTPARPLSLSTVNPFLDGSLQPPACDYYRHGTISAIVNNTFGLHWYSRLAVAVIMACGAHNADSIRSLTAHKSLPGPCLQEEPAA
ncbi:hypothetical protein CY34DRAFT_800380 [Suillus luteus UH-Slu-Lm8-n1]|uniref:Uncharacterized protein n=1 Tax=Suillus luteus UH-Slu-Lm8-n1 TaxID=930992 RepID=A0A0D0A8T7_9AGAM|nr:hypothetical protein CY34DRAFT_800380 [Suillus luteus UH-Slu-Lm8-n1]